MGGKITVLNHRLILDPSQQIHTVYQKKRIKQTPPKVKPKLKSLTSNQVRKKIAKGELR